MSAFVNDLDDGIEFTPGLWMTLKWQDRQMWWKEESACRENTTVWIIALTRVA